MPPEDDPVVAVVDDDPLLVDLYAQWASDRADVRTATVGSEALAVIDDAVDVVFLDRKLPDVHGDEVLHTLRERGITAQVAMLTAVDADFDILELPFDDYLHKPVSRAEFEVTLERLSRRSQYEQCVRTFHELAAKRAALETVKDPRELQHSQQYRQLLAELDRTRAEAAEYLEEFDSRDYRGAFKRLSVST